MSTTLHAPPPVRSHRQGCPNCGEFPVQALLAGVTHLYARARVCPPAASRRCWQSTGAAS